MSIQINPLARVSYPYSDLFPSVRQRVAAFKLYREFCESKNMSVEECRENNISEFLDSAYRFLNKTAYDINHDEFLAFCAQKEGMSYEKYIQSIGL